MSTHDTAPTTIPTSIQKLEPTRPSRFSCRTNLTTVITASAWMRIVHTMAPAPSAKGLRIAIRGVCNGLNPASRPTRGDDQNSVPYNTTLFPIGSRSTCPDVYGRWRSWLLDPAEGAAGMTLLGRRERKLGRGLPRAVGSRSSRRDHPLLGHLIGPCRTRRVTRFARSLPAIVG